MTLSDDFQFSKEQKLILHIKIKLFQSYLLYQTPSFLYLISNRRILNVYLYDIMYSLNLRLINFCNNQTLIETSSNLK